ncbi:MAG: hypothetical protein J6M31_03270 [Bacteroidales bacterium]|nr:hypothetical protein [Bacteroidales bacterium]
MKPILRRGLGLLTVIAFTGIWMLSSSMGEKVRRERTCQGKGSLEVIVTDSLERTFVARQDIENWLEKEYRAYAGLPLDSVDLDRIEHIILSHSAVRDCEAWLTDDGILHVEIGQRQPAVRFDDGSNGYYADAEGFIFPLQSRGGADVPVISGKLPLKVERGFKGFPEDPAQHEWLMQMVNLVNYMKGTVWEHNLSAITVDAAGNLVLLPREGKEKFLFGAPTEIPGKFALLEAYYQSVAPAKAPGYYKHVDLRYAGQLVCKK